MADKNESGTTCDDPNFYCEYFCDGGEWTLIGSKTGTGYYCPTSLSGACTNSAYTCASPLPSGGGNAGAAAAGSIPRTLPINSGDYVCDGDQLHLLSSRTDVDHYCPPTLDLDDADNSPTVADLRKLAENSSFVSATVNIAAVKKADVEG